MVKRNASATSLTGSGVRDWLLQRLSAVILGALIVVLAVFFIRHPHPSYSLWVGFMAQTWVRVLCILAALSIFVHGWIGIWGVLTDYVKCSCIRLGLQALFFLGLLAMAVWTVLIMGSV